MTRDAVKATKDANQGAKDNILARRDLFRVAGLGALGAAAVGATAAGGTAQAAPAEAKTTGYRETDHVRKVYDVSRF